MCQLCDQPDLTPEEYDDHLRALVDQHRFAIQSVGGSRCRAEFSYTVGLTAHGLPQLVVIGVRVADASRLLRHHSIVVVLSDFIAEGWDRPLRRLAARHEVVAITVDDPREHDLPESGWIEMQDAETGRRVLVDTGSREVRQRLKALAARRREERIRTLTASGADLVMLETGTDYALPLRRAFALRARRIRRG